MTRTKKQAARLSTTATVAPPRAHLMVRHEFDRADAVALLAAWYVDVNYQTFKPLTDEEVHEALRFQLAENGGPDHVWAERNDLSLFRAEAIGGWAEQHVDRVWPELTPDTREEPR